MTRLSLGIMFALSATACNEGGAGSFDAGPVGDSAAPMDATVDVRADSGVPNDSSADVGVADASAMIDAAVADTSPERDASAGDSAGGLDAAAPLGVPAWVGVGEFNLIGSTRDGTNWFYMPPTGSGNPHTDDLLRAVAWNNGVFIAVGGSSRGYVLRSTDGETWTQSGSSDAPTWLGGVAGRGNVWMAGGGGGLILRSDDNGLSWAVVSNGGASLRSIAGSGTTWVAAGNEGALKVSVDDGLSWTDESVTTSGTGGFSFVLNHAGRWIAAGRGWNAAEGGQNYACFASSDALSWAECAFEYGSVYSGGVHNGELYVFSEGTRSTSRDGITWTTVPSNVLQAAYADGRWVAKRHGRTLTGPDLDSLAPVAYTAGFRGFAVGYVRP